MDVKIPKVFKYIFFAHIAIFLLVAATEPSFNSFVNSMRLACQYPIRKEPYYPVVITVLVLYSIYNYREVNK